MWETANILKTSKSSAENHLHQLGYVDHFDIWGSHKLSGKNLFFKKKMHFWLCQVFAVARRLSLVAANGGYSQAECKGFSLRWRLSLQSTGSRRVGFSSCSTTGLGVLQHVGCFQTRDQTRVHCNGR